MTPTDMTPKSPVYNSCHCLFFSFFYHSRSFVQYKQPFRSALFHNNEKSNARRKKLCKPKSILHGIFSLHNYNLIHKQHQKSLPNRRPQPLQHVFSLQFSSVLLMALRPSATSGCLSTVEEDADDGAGLSSSAALRGLPLR